MELKQAIKCEYTKKFFSPANDVLLNPVEARSSGWSVFTGIKMPSPSSLANNLLRK